MSRQNLVAAGISCNFPDYEIYRQMTHLKIPIALKNNTNFEKVAKKHSVEAVCAAEHCVLQRQGAVSVPRFRRLAALNDGLNELSGILTSPRLG